MFLEFVVEKYIAFLNGISGITDGLDSVCTDGEEGGAGGS